MKNKTRNIAWSAILMALSVVFLYLANLIPTSRLGIVAISSLFAIAAVIEAGLVSSIFVFVGSSILGFLLVPDKTTVLIYVLFFGYYPVIKSLAENIHVFILKWVLKVGVFNAAFTGIWFLFKGLLFSGSYATTNLLVIYLAANCVFIVYDIGLTKLISFYIARISKNIKK